MKTSELFAVSQWLSVFPENVTFDDVLYRLLDPNDETVVPWHVIETYPRRDIAEFIADTQTHFANVTNEDRI
jgi:hypothetical protein